jgi:hypothetical protein
LQKGAGVDQRLPGLADGCCHRGDPLPVRLGEFAKLADRFRELLATAGDCRGLFLFGPQESRKRRRRARLRLFARVTTSECRNIAAARHFDDQRIVAPDSPIVSRQRLAHANGLDPYDRIGLRIKIDTATERFHCDGIGFELVAVARERHFDDEGKKACQPVGVAERTAIHDPVEFLADIVDVRPLRICMSNVAVSPGKPILHRPPW